jgi:hypothetical protein
MYAQRSVKGLLCVGVNASGSLYHPPSVVRHDHRRIGYPRFVEI